MASPPSRRIFRIREFELDVAAYELRREGRRVRLEKRPMELLILMAGRPGELISRAEIVKALWGNDVFIEVDTSVNTVVRKVRQALRDSPDTPTFIETVPAKGYRFIAPVEPLSPPENTVPAAAPSVDDAPPPRRFRAAAPLVALLCFVALGAWLWYAARQTPTRLRVAVLPFEVNALDAGREYLADALHEETIAALGQVEPERIEVVTRRSVLPYGDRTKPIQQIAPELGVQYLVESSIHAENGRIRVLARLIRVQDEKEIWTRSYEYEPQSVLDFQKALSVRIAGEIRHTLSPARLDALARRHTANREAFHLYLQGLSAWNQLKPPQTTERAIGYYVQATQRDPAYALPWAGLAILFAGAPINGDADPRQLAPQARRTAERAIAADGLLAEAQTAAGAVHFWFDWDWTRAEAMFKKAVASDPNYAFARRMVGIVLAHAGRHDEARDSMRQLIRLEPTYEMNWALRAQVAFLARQYSEAVEFAQQATVFQPHFWIADYQLAMAYERTNRLDLALATIEKHLNAGPANSKLHSMRGYVLARMGRTAEARDVLATLNRMASDRYVPPYARALVHAGLGERDEAFQWLERAIEVRDVHLIALPTDAKWDEWRSDRRFIDIVKRCGFVAPAS